MVELLDKFNGGELIALVAISGGLLCGTVAIIGDYWHKIQETALKRDMLSRGMTAEEIRVVLDGGSKLTRRELRRQDACHT